MSEPAKPEIIRKIEAVLDRYSFKLHKTKPPALSPQGLPYANFHRRMFAATVDALIIMLMVTPFNGLIMAYAYGDLKMDPVLVDQAVSAAKSQAEAEMAVLKLQIDAGLGKVAATLIQIQFTIFAVYSFVFWHWKAATPGKLLMGLRIVDDKTGAPVTDFQSIIRLMAYIISGAPLMLGFFWIGLNKKKQGWHDMLADTAVVIAPRLNSQAADPSDSPAPGVAE